MRAFLAVPLDAAVNKTLGRWQEELKAYKAPVKWVSKEHFHVTTHFFEEISNEQATECRQRLQEAVQRFPGFRCEIKGTGRFPTESRPKVLWVGMGDGAKTFANLAKACQEVATAVGCPVEDRPYHAHVTMGRVNGEKNINSLLQKMDLDKELLWGMTAVKRVLMLESRLTREGPVYTLLWEVPLDRSRPGAG